MDKNSPAGYWMDDSATRGLLMPAGKRFILNVGIAFAVLTMFIVALLVHYSVFAPAYGQRQKSFEEVDWISNCALLTGHGIKHCTNQAEELQQMGYFEQSTADVGVDVKLEQN